MGRMLTREYGRAQHAIGEGMFGKGKLCPCCFDHRVKPRERRRTQRRRERQEFRQEVYA